METLLVYPGANENEEYIVPDGIRRIDKVAFAGCSNLKKIILPETLEDIGIGAFEDCSELKEIEIPYNVKKITSSFIHEMYFNRKHIFAVRFGRNR